MVEDYFRTTATHLDRAVRVLVDLKHYYERQSLAPGELRAVTKALDAKIDAAKAIKLNPEAYPWTEWK